MDISSVDHILTTTRSVRKRFDLTREEDGNPIRHYMPNFFVACAQKRGTIA